MTNEPETLEPCPFCGGEDGKHSEVCYIIMSQENVSFINLHHTPMYTIEELLEAYRTRYKRTCHIENASRPNGAEGLGVFGKCSECGGEIETVDHCSPSWRKTDKFCRTCGAEVADG